MKLKPEQLVAHLQNKPMSFYLIGGDEPLLLKTSSDSIRAFAKNNGFIDHQIFHVDKGFNWQQILEESYNFSLFGDKKLIEIRLPTSKPGDQGSKALRKLCETQNKDTLILLLTGKLDKATLNTKWAKTIDKSGCIIQIWPISQEQFPQWLRHQLTEQGLPCDREIVHLIAARTEGNLLAANQEIEKLKLLAGNGSLSLEQVRESVADSSRYNVFVLSEECMKNNPTHALKILNGLKEEGTEPILILWALTRDIRAMIELSLNRGDSQSIFRRNKIFGAHQKLILQNVNQFSLTQLQQLLTHCHQADLNIKGIPSTTSYWESFTFIILSLSNIQIMSPTLPLF